MHNDPPQDIWDRGTRWLHAGLAVAVTFQLFVAFVMEVPQPGLRPQPFGLQAYQAHKTVGAVVIALTAGHWLWSLLGRPGALRHLFPWGRVERASVVADLVNLKAGRLPAGGPGGGLAGLVHGLGFLAVSGMAVLGGLLLALEAGGFPPALFRRVGEGHSLVAGLVWLYWLGHLAMVAVHEGRGHRILAGIFKP